MRKVILFIAVLFSLGCQAQKPGSVNNIRPNPSRPKPTPPKTSRPKPEPPKEPVSPQPSKATGTINGHGYVDLGLPSGLKWATCNVGANRPEEYGDYFAWGETSPKSSYDEENSETYGKDNSWLQRNGYIDSYGDLTMAHDAARANWGSSWRLPTKDEIDELVENTTTKWTTVNGKEGRLVTSKRNGKSIFLPSAGYRYGTPLNGAGEDGYSWSTTPFERDATRAYYL